MIKINAFIELLLMTMFQARNHVCHDFQTEALLLLPLMQDALVIPHDIAWLC